MQRRAAAHVARHSRARDPACSDTRGATFASAVRAKRRSEGGVQVVGGAMSWATSRQCCDRAATAPRHAGGTRGRGSRMLLRAPRRRTDAWTSSSPAAPAISAARLVPVLVTRRASRRGARAPPPSLRSVRHGRAPRRRRRARSRRLRASRCRAVRRSCISSGTPHPQSVEGGGIRARRSRFDPRERGRGNATRSVAHLVYVSVAQPAPAMHAYVAARVGGRSRDRAMPGSTATIAASVVRAAVRGTGGPLVLVPFYAIARDRCRATRAIRAQRLGLVTVAQMVRALVHGSRVAATARDDGASSTCRRSARAP